MARIVTQIQVGEYRIGIIGLDAVFAELAESHAHGSDENLQEILMAQVSRRNYIAPNLRSLYAETLLGKFRDFVDNNPTTINLQSGSTTMDIKVLGPGCPKCATTEKNVMDAVAESGVDASVEKIKDVMQIAKFGVFGTPAVVIDGEVKCVGKVPSKEEVKKWLED